MGYFKKHWPAELQEKVQTCVEEEVHPRFPAIVSGADCT